MANFITGLLNRLLNPHRTGSEYTNAVADAFLGLANDGQSQFSSAQQFNAEQSQLQRDWEERMYFEDRAYQSPANQMNLYRQAGLNPSLMYGQPIQTGQLGSGSEATSPSPSNSISSLLGLGTDIAVMPAQIDLMRAQASEIRSRIPANEKKPAVMQATIDNLVSQSRLNAEKVNTEESVQSLNKILGEKHAEETRKIVTETEQLIETFPLKLQELNATISELNSRKELNSENAKVARVTAENYVIDLRMKWKVMNQQVELMKASRLDNLASAVLKVKQAEYYKIVGEISKIDKDVKGETAKAEAYVSILTRLMGATSGMISAIASIRSGTPSFNPNSYGVVNQWDASTPNYGF